MILPLLHGYTTADLDRLAMLSAGTTHANGGFSIPERVDMAWSAMAEHLVVAEERPDRNELVRVGRQEIYRGVRAHHHHYGVSKGDVLNGRGSMTAFVVYWWCGSQPSHEDRIVERIAVAQIWPRLTHLEQQTLAALAAHDSYGAAAEALGVSYRIFADRVRMARQRFLSHWHKGETPSRTWRPWAGKVGSYARQRAEGPTADRAKVCRRCGTDEPDRFCASALRHVGVSAMCRECMTAYQKELKADRLEVAS